MQHLCLLVRALQGAAATAAEAAAAALAPRIGPVGVDQGKEGASLPFKLERQLPRNKSADFWFAITKTREALKFLEQKCIQ